MTSPRIAFDQVWKKFRRGERHDSLRDLLPAMLGTYSRTRSLDKLNEEEFWVLRDASFEVEPGEAVGIIGRNGAGKSTVLKVLTRILRPTRGRSEVHGRVGALIELAAGFHQDLTGRENIYLQGAMMGMRRAQINKRFDEIVDFAGVSDFIDTPVKRYSSGMNARLGFSIAAHLDPDVLFIDEVLAVGDLNFQQKCYERLREYKAKGLAIAFVSHNMQAISLLSDRVVYLRPGLSPVVGSVGEMVAKYVSNDSQDVDSRVKVASVWLSANGAGNRLEGAVRPTTPLRLVTEIETGVSLPRCGVQLRVSRSDGLIVFEDMSLTEKAGAVDLAPGSRLVCDVTFRANLLRGVYTISGFLLDRNRTWERIDLGILSSFVVEETTRWSGVAELETNYSLQHVDQSVVTT